MASFSRGPKETPGHFSRCDLKTFSTARSSESSWTPSRRGSLDGSLRSVGAQRAGGFCSVPQLPFMCALNLALLWKGGGSGGGAFVIYDIGALLSRLFCWESSPGQRASGFCSFSTRRLGPTTRALSFGPKALPERSGTAKYVSGLQGVLGRTATFFPGEIYGSSRTLEDMVSSTEASQLGGASGC